MVKLINRKSIFGINPRFKEQAAPATPPAGFAEAYAKTDGLMYSKDDAGVEARMSNFVICTSSTRPASPVDGMQIYETDTFKTYIYIASKTGWFPPWNTAWGVLAKFYSTADTGASSVSNNSDMQLVDVPARVDRSYAVYANFTVLISAASAWSMDLRVEGVTVGRFGFEPSPNTVLGDYKSGVCYWNPASTGLFDVGIRHEELSGSATLTYKGSATMPRMFWVEDIGPRT